MPVLVGERLGQARAYNDVFATLDTPYVVWISDDNEVVNHGLDVAVDILERLPRVGMVGVKVKDVEGPFVEATAWCACGRTPRRTSARQIARRQIAPGAVGICCRR